MPFSVCGTLSSLQRLMDSVQWALLCLHRRTLPMQQYKQHLWEVFQRFCTAGLILCGSKCHLEMPEVLYSRHAFLANGMSSESL